MATVGDRIRYYREDRGLTQMELAARVGIGYATISKWETNVIKNIPFERLCTIADALDVTPNILLGLEQDLIDDVVTDPKQELDAIWKDLSERQQIELVKFLKVFLR